MRRRRRVALRQTLAALGRSLRDPVRLAGCVEALGGLVWIPRERRVVPDRIERGLEQLARH